MKNPERIIDPERTIDPKRTIDPERTIDIEQIAALMECAPCPTAAQRAGIEQLDLYASGYGSIARPMVDRLTDFGLNRCTLADPKAYSENSVASQCEPHEVGRSKVDVGRERLMQRGVQVRAYANDLYTLPDGVVTPNTIMVASVDNRRADIGANRLAVRMQARLVKINIEPRFNLIAVRCYDFRDRPSLCVECQFSAQAYENQRHPKSCDGPDGSGERRTAAPRWLSQAAGDVAAMVVAELTERETAERWYGRQWQWMIDGGSPQWSELTPSVTCRCDHGQHWPELQRLECGPDEITLQQLLGLAKIGGDADVRFDQQVTTRVCCNTCGGIDSRVRWLSEVDRPVGQCECGGRLLPIPYFTYRQIPLAELQPVMEQPLAAWGMVPHAVIEIAHRRSFAIGEGLSLDICNH